MINKAKETIRETKNYLKTYMALLSRDPKLADSYIDYAERDIKRRLEEIRDIGRSETGYVSNKIDKWA